MIIPRGQTVPGKPSRLMSNRMGPIALGLVVLLYCFAAQAGPALRLDKAQEVYPLGQRIEYSEDPSGQLGIEDLVRQPEQAWKKHRDPLPNFGFSQSTYWFRLTVQTTDEAQRWLLEVAYPMLDEVSIYTFTGVQALQTVHTGDSRPFMDRPHKHTTFVIPLLLPPAKPVTVYLRIKSTGTVQVPLYLWQDAAFHERNETSTILLGGYFGIILIMIVYASLLYIKIREASYIYYALFVAMIGLFTAGLWGWGYRYLWPEAVRFQQYNVAFFISLSIVFAARFIHQFLALKQKAPKIGHILTGTALISLANLVLLPLIGYHVGVQIALAMTLVAALAALFAGIRLWRQGDYMARYFTTAWGLFLISALLATLEKIGLMPSTFWADFILPVGVISILGLLSFTLGEKINRGKQERIQAQQQIILLKEENQAELEQKIAERTIELEQANASLKLLATTDSLTGLFNRQHFLERAIQEINIAWRYQRPIAVAMLDIDFFKSVNDTYGHDVGDKVLQHLSVLCRRIIRETDVLGRLGGEEFGIVLLESSAASATAMAERLRHEIEVSPYEHPGASIKVTVSLGVCAVEATQQPVTIEQMLKVADDALYQAKHAGRNRVVVSIDVS